MTKTMAEWCYSDAASECGASEVGWPSVGGRSSRTKTRLTVMGRHVLVAEGLSFSLKGMADLASRWGIEKKAETNTLDTRTSTGAGVKEVRWPRPNGSPAKPRSGTGMGVGGLITYGFSMRGALRGRVCALPD
jgi:hypothetical protein